MFMSSELKNPFGIRNGRVVLIGELSDAESGYACNCTCPSCSGTFIARMGDVRQKHFAHDGKPCSKTASILTALYLLLKESIADTHQFYTPPLYAFRQKDLLPYVRADYWTIENLYSFSSRYSDCVDFSHEELIHKQTFPVSLAEIRYDSKQIPSALILTETNSLHQLAVVIVPPSTLCKVSHPKQYKSFSTVAVYFNECFDWLNISASFLKEQFYSQNIHLEWVAGDILDKKKKTYIESKIKEHNRAYEILYQRQALRFGLSPANPFKKSSSTEESHSQNFWPEHYIPGENVPNEPLYDAKGTRWFICRYCKKAVNYAQAKIDDESPTSAICWSCLDLKAR